MKQKKKKIALIAVFAILLIVSAGLLFYALNREESQKEAETQKGNIAGVEWYDINEKEFTISTADQLYELVELSNFYDFKGQTIKLDADIVVNDGNAEDWGTEKPERRWFPIRKFAGTFDGQGHTISGLYNSVADIAMAMFADTNESAVIQDFKLVNTYFHTWGNKGTASISSNGGGTFKRIYSDAILQCEDGFCGGLLSRVQFQNASLEECWFDGTIYAAARTVGGLVDELKKADMTISHCLNSGSVNSTHANSGAVVGGIIACSNQWFKQNLTIEDCLNVGQLTTENMFYVGSVVGCIRNGTNVEFENTVASYESYDTAVGRSGDQGKLTGAVIRVENDNLIGQGGYEWTNLDFENYWTTTKDGTPILQYFAEETQSVAGLNKKFNVDWYDTEKSEFTINTAEEFYGFTLLSRYTNFKEKIIKLGANITLNKGNASEWAKKAPANKWMPVGTFIGTFDGQGHTISGVYATGEDTIGLFTRTSELTTLKNFSLKNSYFYAEGSEEKQASFVGSIVARGGGVIDTVYSNAIVAAGRLGAGGFIGQMNSDNPKNRITNCWFDGTVNMLTDDAIKAGGFIGTAVIGTVTLEHCLNSGTINSEVVKRGAQVGGLFGNVEYNDAKAVVKDSLNVGTLNTKNQFLVGSVLGTVTKQNAISINDVYASLGSYDVLIGRYGDTGAIAGVPLAVMQDKLVGYNAYQWTSLNFSKYWAVVEGSTPVLRSFAKSVPSVAGLEKMIDVSWHDSAKSEYTITTRAQLNGLSMMSVSTDFAGKTIKLGADIVMNKGNAADWAKDAPELNWMPIVKFSGTFDGQGHTISGIHSSGESTIALFAKTTADSVIKNLKLTNSYFYAEGSEEKQASFVGSIVARGGGVIDTVYSNAIVAAGRPGAGGFIGQMNSDNPKNRITNCWFDGTVNMLTDDATKGGGFIGSVVIGKVTIEHCLNTGTINSEVSNKGAQVGGIAAHIEYNDASVEIRDTLSAGEINTKNKFLVGSIVGIVGKDRVLSMDNVYAATETYKRLIGEYGDKGIILGAAKQIDRANLTGYYGYQFTALDFQKYWAVDLHDVPVLQSYTTSIPSLAGVPKIYDTDWYDEDADEYYIGSKEELYGLAKLSENTDFADKTIYLTQDINVNLGDASEWGETPAALKWTPISTFAGTFDGQGHSIIGLYVESTANCAGFFSYLTGTVQNLAIKDSTISTTSNVAGAFAGRGQGATFENLYTNATVSATGGVSGGIVGQLNTDKGSMLEECWFDGTVKAAQLGAGGIIGGVIVNTSTMTNCLNTGVIENTYKDGLLGSWVGGLCGYTHMSGVLNVSNSMSIEDITAPGGAGNTGSVVGWNNKTNASNVYVYAKDGAVTTGDKNVTGITYLTSAPNAEQLKGKAVYSSTNLDFINVWAARTDKAPALKYWLTKFKDTSMIAPTNADLDAIADTSWYTTTNSGVTYILQDVADLYGFAKLVNSGKGFGGQTVKLGADITVNTGDASGWKTVAPDYEWTPIGSLTVGKNFNGTFDGDGHSISGLYFSSGDQGLGLFGFTGAGSIIQNVKLENTYFCATNSAAAANHLGGAQLGAIAGRSFGTITNVYVTDSVYLDCYGYYCGGIAGLNAFGTNKTYSKCWFDGHLDMKTTGRAGGGIIGIIKGDASTMNLKDCLFSGTITTSFSSGGCQIAGLVAVTEANMSVTDCLVTGTVTSTINKFAYGAVFGFTTAGKTIILTDVYEDDNTAPYTIGQYGDNATKTGQIQTIPHANLLGDNAKTYASGLFTDNGDTWKAVAGSTPELKKNSL